jgi:adenylyltransferase/sulfurtransferase
MAHRILEDLGTDERVRYARQLLLPAVGEAGQRRLKAARVFLSGLGGLGSIAAYYLTAAGVGSLRAVDQDRVSLENLNRQILHRMADIGRPKAVSAAEKLRALNPAVDFTGRQTTLCAANAAALIGGCDVIVDALDNLESRKLLNRAAVAAGIPLVSGGIEGFDGMVTTIVAGRSACLECIFPGTRAARPGPAPAVGPTAGVVASLQSLEVLKLILGRKPALQNRLLIFKGLEARFKSVSLAPDPHCAVCGRGA